MQPKSTFISVLATTSNSGVLQYIKMATNLSYQNDRRPINIEFNKIQLLSEAYIDFSPASSFHVYKYL